MREFPDALGVSGYITNETEWQRTKIEEKPSPERFYFDGWNRIEGSRFSLRRKFGLEPDCPPGIMPDFSHGYSTGFLPPTEKFIKLKCLWEVLHPIKGSVFEDLKFSSLF